MPKLQHEALVHLVRNAPEMVVELLRQAFGVELAFTARPRPSAAEITDLDLAEYRADGVFTVGEPVTAAYIVEAQGAIKPSKRRAWPMYAAGVHARWQCPVMLVIVAPDRKVAAWAQRPIDLGHGRFVLHPYVLGPAQVPVITDVAAARRSPELAVLSVAAHGREPDAHLIAVAALTAARDLDSPRGMLYADFVHAHLGAIARAALEKLMLSGKYEYQSDFARKYYFQGKNEGKAEGKAEGKGEALCTLLELKGLVPGAEVRARIDACRDQAQLDVWLRRVLTATRLADVFAEDV